MTNDIIFEDKSGLGIITLNRPEVLNALSIEMCIALDNKLTVWEKDNSIQAIIIKSSGGKAFCAGGDVRAIVEQGYKNNFAGKHFFAAEYKMNARIFHFPKPFIALLDGITMGGGVGVAIHGSHRIITEKTNCIYFICERRESIYVPVSYIPKRFCGLFSSTSE